MTDRELLLLAAKAAGLKLDGPVPSYAHGYPDAFLVLNEQGGHTIWNPLAWDGDALRLAVACDITAGKSLRDDAAGAIILLNGRITTFVERWADHSGDRNAATRRAIVRAAAAIGAGHHEGGGE